MNGARSILVPPMSSHIKRLLIVWHSKTGNTQALAAAARAGAAHPDLDPVDVRYLTAASAGPDDLLWADGLLLATPENFGYMSGAMKDFFDRTFYEVEGQLQPLPYALIISAGNDGSGAQRSITRIVNGYPFAEALPPLIVQGEVEQAHLDAATELGMTLAAGLALGMY